MAIRQRGETWQVYWNNPYTGKRESKSFGLKEEAEKENSLVQHRLKYERESFKPEEPVDVPKQHTLEQVYIEYLCEKNFSKKELSNHRCHMQIALNKLGDRDVREIDRADLEEVKRAVLAEDISDATKNTHLRIVRTIIYFAIEKGYMQPVKFPKIPNPNYKRFIPPSQEEITAIYQAAPPHIRRVVVLGAFFGIRIGQCELFQLTWEDVDLATKMIRVHGSKKNPNSPWREIPIREDLVSLFAEWKEQDGEVKYVINYHGKPVKSIKRAWKNTLRQAGIERRIRPYDLRHMFGTEMIASGVDIGTIAKLMGHSSPTMLLTHYQHVMDRQKREAVESLSNFTHVPNSCANKKVIQ